MALNLQSRALQIPVAPIFFSEEMRKKIFLACRARKAIKVEAFQELLKWWNSNHGGRAKYCDIRSIVKMYLKLGYEYVTRGALCYMLSERDSIPIEIQTEHSDSDRSNVSSLSGTQTSNTDSNQIWACNGSVVLGGRPKGSTEEYKSDELVRTKDALTEAAQLYQMEQKKYRANTVANRTRRDNITGEVLQRVSPLQDLDPLLVDYCLCLTWVGCPLDKAQLILLASSLIQNTVYSEKFFAV
jgi:hypothetical protein